MAAVGRTDETQIVNDNVYDNNAKEINPEMLRAVLASLIESNFNLVDDVLKSLNYETGITLEEKLGQNNFLASGTLNIGNATSQSIGSTFTVTGDFASAVVIDANIGSDTLIAVNFTSALPNNNYMAIISTQSNSVNYDNDNDLIVTNFKSQTTTSFQIGIRKIAAITTNVKLYVKIASM